MGAGLDMTVTHGISTAPVVLLPGRSESDYLHMDQVIIPSPQGSEDHVDLQ